MYFLKGRQPLSKDSVVWQCMRCRNGGIVDWRRLNEPCHWCKVGEVRALCQGKSCGSRVPKVQVTGRVILCKSCSK